MKQINTLTQSKENKPIDGTSLWLSIKPLKNCFHFSPDYDMSSFDPDTIKNVTIRWNDYGDGYVIVVTTTDNIIEQFDIECMFIEGFITNGDLIDKVISGLTSIWKKIFKLKK